MGSSVGHRPDGGPKGVLMNTRHRKTSRTADPQGRRRRAFDQREIRMADGTQSRRLIAARQAGARRESASDT